MSDVTPATGWRRRRRSRSAVRNFAAEPPGMYHNGMSRLTAAGLLLAATLGAQEPWWEGEPLRIIDLTTSLSQIDSSNPAESAAIKASLGFNSEHLEIMLMPAGMDDRGFYFQSKVATRTNRDYLRS